MSVKLLNIFNSSAIHSLAANSPVGENTDKMLEIDAYRAKIARLERQLAEAKINHENLQADFEHALAQFHAN